MTSPSLKIVFAGTPAFALPALEALVASGHDVIAVFTQPDRPVGRGQKLAYSPVKQFALAQDIPVHQPLRMGEDAALFLREHAVDVMVVAAFGQLLPVSVLEAPRWGCVNIHASILPRWRGAAPVVRAIQAGDSVTGVSVMLMERGLDTGPVLSECRVNILPADTQGSLTQTLAECGASLLLRSLKRLPALLVQALPQPAEGITYASKIDKGEAEIDWQQDATTVCQHIKAFNPMPMAFSFFQGKSRVRVLFARVTAAPVSCPPGTVFSVDAQGVGVACGRGAVLLTCVQLPGKPVWFIGQVPQQWPFFLVEGAVFSSLEG